MLFTSLRHQGDQVIIAREHNVGLGCGKRCLIDFRLQLSDGGHLIEIKACCISQAARTPRNLHFYFRNDKLGIQNDLRKLQTLDCPEKKWILLFVYPRPKDFEWTNAVNSLSYEFNRWKCVSNPEKFPEFAYLSLWEHR